MSPSSFRVGAWCVEPRRYRLTRGEEAKTLEPKVMDVLVVLVRHAGEVVTREHLMETVWPGVVVGEEALTRCISELRRAFGDDHRQPHVVETIRKTGYRLIASVSSGEPVERTRATGTSGIRAWTFGGLAAAALVMVALLAWRGSEPSVPMRILPLTTYAGNEMQPVFSPDGHHVAFAWDDRSGTRLDVYVKALRSETPLRLTADSAYDVSPTFSPDGSQLAFARVWKDCTILTVPLLGGPERRLTDCGGWGNPELDWSPDPSVPLIAVSEAYARDEPRRLVLISLETLEKRPLTTPAPPHYGDRLPRFSPDGTRLAFVRTTDVVSDIYVISVTGGEPVRLTNGGLDIAGLDWAPDGRSLVAASTRTGTSSLWRVPLHGGHPELLLVGADDLHHPTVARRGGMLAYEQWSNETNIYRVELTEFASDVPPEPVAASTRRDAAPHLAPDGDHLAFISDRSGHDEVWIIDTTGNDPFPVTAFDSPAVRHPRWAPDGRMLAFDARPEGQADVYVVDTAGGSPRRLTTSPAVDLFPAWAPDGRTVFFASDRTGTWQVWSIPVAGGEATPVTRHGGYAPQASPDGRHLYYTKRDTTGIWRMKLADGSEEHVSTLLPPAYDGQWAITDAGLFLTRVGPDGECLLTRVDPDTGDALDMVMLPGLHRPSGLTVSMDGRWLYYTRLDRSESDLMLVEGW